MVAPDAAKGKSKPQRGTVHGIAVEIRGPGAERLARDFDFYFHRPVEESEDSAPYSVALELLARAPKPRDLPSRKATRVFSDCVLYENTEGTLVYEYSGGAVLRVQRSGPASHAELICESPSLAEEIGYLYLQSELGRFLDEQGLHRVHALGLGLPDGRAALALIPSGGGKSTLGLSLLEKEAGVLLSDDTPLLDRLGRAWPYPLRLSFREGTTLPAAWAANAQRFERRKHGAKILVPTAALPSRLLPRPGDHFRPGFLILAERHGSRTEPLLERLPRWRGLAPLTRDLVVGLGVPQVAELILTRGLGSLPGLAPTAASRLAAATAYLARAQVFRLTLARDPARNAAGLAELFGRHE